MAVLPNFGNQAVSSSARASSSEKRGVKRDSTGEERAWTCEDLEKELEVLVGLDELKTHLRRWCKGLILDRQRRKLGVTVKQRMAPNMIFLGNPGTGKTSVARMLARILHNLGVLRRNVVIEVQRTDLVGSYLGQTGPQTRAILKKASGGVLFVDEAYRLMVAESEKDYGREALKEIMSQMDSGKLMCIFAGYEKPMKRVLDCNEGFRRRVGKQFVFQDYTPLQVADIMLVKMNGPEPARALPGFKLSDGCSRGRLARLIEERIPLTERQRRNGGLELTLLEEARDQLDERLSEACCDLKALVTVTMRDLIKAADEIRAMGGRG